ncbi:MAG: hypothetical protein WGN25_18050 [Candidatus Electrothrix sp. GW3-4]
MIPVPKPIPGQVEGQGSQHNGNAGIQGEMRSIAENSLCLLLFPLAVQE